MDFNVKLELVELVELFIEGLATFEERVALKNYMEQDPDVLNLLIDSLESKISFLYHTEFTESEIDNKWKKFSERMDKLKK